MWPYGSGPRSTATRSESGSHPGGVSPARMPSAASTCSPSSISTPTAFVSACRCPIALPADSFVSPWRRCGSVAAAACSADRTPSSPGASTRRGARKPPDRDRRRGEHHTEQHAEQDVHTGNLKGPGPFKSRARGRGVARDAVDGAARERRGAAEVQALERRRVGRELRAAGGRRPGAAGRSRRRRRRRPGSRCAPRGRRAASTWRARMRSRKPGAKRSTCASIRSTMPSVHGASCGPCVYAQAVCLPSGARVGSATLCWPSSRNGCVGGPVVGLLDRAQELVLGAGRRGPCRRRATSGFSHGIGPSSAQSTFTVAAPRT